MLGTSLLQTYSNCQNRLACSRCILLPQKKALLPAKPQLVGQSWGTEPPQGQRCSGFALADLREHTRADLELRNGLSYRNLSFGELKTLLH